MVPEGESLTAALKIAEEIAAFPQDCLRNDRASAMTQWAMPMDEALQNENVLGLKSLQAGAASGAARFASGKGRSGDFSDI